MVFEPIADSWTAAFRLRVSIVFEIHLILPVIVRATRQV
jgi:hypothetical protein